MGQDMAAYPHNFAYLPASYGSSFGATYGGQGALGSPYGYGGGHFHPPAGHGGYGNYTYSGFPGRIALPSYPFTGYPGPETTKDSGTYADKTSGRYRLGMAPPTGSFPGDDFPVPGGPGYGRPGVSDYYYGKVGFGPIQGSAQPFKGEQAERSCYGNLYANRQ